MRTGIGLAILMLAVAIGHAEEATTHRWMKDVTAVPIPSVPAKGMAYGVRFSVEKAIIQNGILTLRQGKDFFADQEFMVFLFLKPGESLDGNTFTVKPTDGHGVPHIHLKYRVEGENVPKTEMFMKGYTMRLEFGTASDNSQQGKIYLCLPDANKSFVAGSFNAEIN